MIGRKRADTQFPRDNEMRKRLWLQKKARRNANPAETFPLVVYGWQTK